MSSLTIGTFNRASARYILSRYVTRQSDIWIVVHPYKYTSNVDSVLNMGLNVLPCKYV